MKPTVVHVISGLGSGKAERMLKRLVLADRGPRASRQVVISLTDSGVYGHALQDAGVDLHCLGLAKPSRMPGALVRLIVLMRRIRPDVVMTWLYHAHFLATLAAIASGIGARRVVWNLSGSSPDFSRYARTAKRVTMLLAWLSPMPSAIVADSRSNQQDHEALGYRARRWLHLPDSTSKGQSRRTLKSHRRLWRHVSGATRRRRFGWQFRRRRRGRFGPVLRGLEEWSARVRRLWLTKTTFIGITGSCGKTTTTRLVGAVLETAGQCRVHAGSNAHTFVIKNVFSVGPSTTFCVQEVSGSWPGRVAEHCKVLQPQVGIVTTVGSDHYKNFRSLEATALSKGQLVELLPRTGTAILNADDQHVIAMAARTSARVITFGKTPTADVRATEVTSAWPGRLAVTVSHGNDTLRIQTKLVGEHWTTSVLAAIACGLVCGVDLKDCAKAIESFEPLFGRYSVHAKPNGPVYIFDHKTPFWTIPLSLAFVKAAYAPRKTVVFGTISDYSGSGGRRYRSVARQALEIADRVVFVGPQSSHVNKLRQGEVRDRLHAFETSFQASEFLAQGAVPGELICIRGSLAADHLERIMLSQLDRVVCWRARCGNHVECFRCRDYRKPHAPPFGLAESNSLVAARLPQKHSDVDSAASARASLTGSPARNTL